MCELMFEYNMSEAGRILYNEQVSEAIKFLRQYHRWVRVRTVVVDLFDCLLYSGVTWHLIGAFIVPANAIE